MIYVRGQAADFDAWANAGNPGWSYLDVLPYFKKLECHPIGNTRYRSGDGKIQITEMKSSAHNLCYSFLKGIKELGYKTTHDFNAEQFEGAGIYEINVRNGQRDSSYTAYLKPALRRKNVSLICNCYVDSIVFNDEKKATSVVIRKGRYTDVIHAKCEIVLAAGAVDSPKLLQLSGVGNSELLNQFDIPVVMDLPGVGQNLQDHLCIGYYYRAVQKTLNDEFRSIAGRIKAGLQYVINRSGPLSLSVNQAGGFLKGRDDEDTPNIQLYFNPMSYKIPDNRNAKMQPEPYSGFLIAFNSCRPSSRGSIKIASADPADAAQIDPNYLSTQHDIDEVIQGSKLIRKLIQTPAIKAIIAEEITPGVSVSSEQDMLDYYHQNAGSIYHLCGSCMMGPNSKTAVVDSRLKVHGVSGLRVIDASIFPSITSGNINAPVMMVAEKGAAMVLQDHSR